MNALRKQIQSMVRVEPCEGGFCAVLTVDPALLVLPDHFPTQPILPGICMVQAVLLAAAAARGLPDLRMTLLKNAKFMRPVEPGDSVAMNGRIESKPGGVLAVKAKLQCRSQAVAEISLEARAPAGGGKTP